MKDILERLDESLDKKEQPKEIIQEIVPLIAAGVAGAAAIGGAAALGAKLMKKLSGNTKVTTDIYNKIIKLEKVKIAKVIFAVHRDSPKFAQKSIGLFSALKSVKDPEVRKELAGLFFILLTKHNVKSSVLGRKGMGTILRSRDKQIAQGAKEAMESIKMEIKGKKKASGTP